MTARHPAPFAHPHRNIEVFGIRPGMVVADFGAGSGAYVLAIAQKLKGGGHVYAVDVQQDLLRRIKNEAHRRGLHNVEVIWSDLEQPNGSKIADHHADLVLVSNLLFQVEAKEVVLAEAWRILHAAGTLAIIDWSDAGGSKSRTIGPRARDVISFDRMVEIADQSGFEPLGKFDAGAHHYGLLFRPKLRDNRKTV